MGATAPNPMPPAGVSASSLPNGLRVVIREDATAPLAAVDLWVRAGAADDDGTGAAHAVEHTLFMGSKDVAAGAVDAAVERVGGVLYAETLADATHYWATVPAGETGVVLGALRDLLHEPTVDAKGWERERRVMLEEIARSRTDAAAEVRRALASKLFGTPFGAPVTGTPDSLAAVTPDAIRAFFRRFYRPDRMVLVVVGPVSADTVRKEAAGILGGIAPAAGDAPGPGAVPIAKAGRVEVSRRDGARVEVGLAFPAAGDADVDVLCTILAGRLSAAVSGLADRAEVSHPWQRAGLVVMTAGGPAENESALRDALRSAAAVSAEGISAAQVSAAIQRRQWAWWLEHEKPAAQSKALGLAAVLGDLDEATTEPERLAAVTPEAVAAAAARAGAAVALKE
jgi:predicted Zn-dependent peptidase